MDESSDPRPVFEGDWQSATGVEKGQHSERVRQWKRRQAAKAGGRTVEPSGERVRSPHAAQPAAPQAHAEDLATLDAIIGSTKSLASDKIRAVEAKQRILARQEAEERESEHGPLLQLRDALSLLPEGQRVDALGTLLHIPPLVVVGEEG